MKLQQRFPNGLRDELPDGSFAMEFHFTFGRMNVHVHFRRINFQKQTADRITALHQCGVIAFEQRKI